METINLTKKQYEKLKKLDLGREIVSTECVMHIIPSKNGWNYETKLLKEFYYKEGRIFGNKLNTINTLINEVPKLGIKELILPDKLAVIDNTVIGFTMDYIENTNLFYKLNDYNVKRIDKIKYLKEIGVILEKIKKARDYYLIDKFYLGDIHEQNFIVDTDDRIRVVDLDSSYIGANNPFATKFLSTNKAILDLPNKYPKNDYIHIPNENTDILCYSMIILNYLSKYPINTLDIADFYNYLEYLRKQGYNYDLLSCFSKLYLQTSNENPYDLLDYIPEDINMANYRIYEYQVKKNIKQPNL